MRVVIDAQIVAGYYRETVNGEEPAYSGPAADLVALLGTRDIGFVDEAGVLEGEYRGLVDPDWFDAWYGERLQAGDLDIVAAPRCPALIKTLTVDFGFPKRSKDCRYVELGRAVVSASEEPAALVSEDLDFYDPKAKRGDAKYRRRLIESQSGPVARYLKRTEHIMVRSVKGHLAA